MKFGNYKVLKGYKSYIIYFLDVLVTSEKKTYYGNSVSEEVSFPNLYKSYYNRVSTYRDILKPYYTLYTRNGN